VADGALDEPAARQHERAERDEHVAERESAASRRALPPVAHRGEDGARDEHSGAESTPDAGERPRQRVEVVLADG